MYVGRAGIEGQSGSLHSYFTAQLLQPNLLKQPCVAKDTTSYCR